MKKRLLFGLMAMCAAVSSFADTVNTKTACYTIVGENECTNGTFADSNFDGWTAVSATEGATCSGLFTYSAENQSITSVSNLYSDGMYYKFSASSSEVKVVSFKIRQVTGTWPFSTNILFTSVTDETSGAVTNTYGCQGTNGAGKNFISLFGNNGGVTSGTDFVNCGYAVGLTADWQTVTFATADDGVARDWYFYISNMATDVEIKDVEIYTAVEVADVRKAAEPLAFAKAILNAYAWGESDELSGLKENIDAVEAITSENTSQDLADALDGLSAAASEFIGKNMDDYLATCANGTKWAEKTAKEQKISGIGDWKIYAVAEDGTESNSGRWFHCNSNDAATREATAYYLDGPNYGYGLALGHQRLVMTKTLKPGSYVFSLKGNSDTHYQSNTPSSGANAYWTNEGFKAGRMIISIVNAEGTVLASSTIDQLPAVWDEYAQSTISAQVAAEGEYKFIVDLDQPTDNEYYGTNRALGGSYFLTEPQVLCKLDGYNASQLAYIGNVEAQIKKGRENYDKAIEYQASEDYLWGKDALKACTDTMLVKVERYEAMDSATIVATFDPDTYVAGATSENGLLEHEVYVEVVRDLLAANRLFLAKNDTLNSLATSIANAEDVLKQRIYDAATGKADLQAVIDGAKTLLAEMQAASYSVENAQTIVAKNEEITEAINTFKATVPATAITTLADIDFTNVATVNEDQTTYTIAGAVNSMILPNYGTDDAEASGTNNFYQGFWSNGEKILADVLRVGNGEAIVNMTSDAQAAYGTNILRISFDYYFARLTKTSGSPGGTYCGFYLNDAENNKIAQLYYSPYWKAVAAEENNTFGIDLNFMPSVGAQSAQNDAIAAESNKSHFEVILDFGEKSMFCTVSKSNGSSITTDKIVFDGTALASFSVVSTHENAARRCWFDNLKIEQIQAGEADDFVPGADGIVEVNTATKKTVAPVKVLKDGRILINGKYGINGVIVK